MVTIWKFGRCLLASSHAGTRLPIANLQGSGRSPSVRHIRGSRFLLSQKIISYKSKNRRQPFRDASCKKSLCMTSYDGIIRIRLKGRSLSTSSQPANTSSPVFYVNNCYNTNYYYCQFCVIRSSPINFPYLSFLLYLNHIRVYLSKPFI